MSKQAKKGGRVGVKLRVSLGLPVGAVMNCADNSGAKTLYSIATKGIKGILFLIGHLNRLPSGSLGDMILVSCKKGAQKLRKKVLQAIVVRQRKPWRRR